jgi:predicted GNAT family N-acyltransferase
MTELRFRVRLADWAAEGRALAQIRHRVFVVEQNVPAELEWDGIDDACRHAIAEDRQGTAIGCGRLLPDGHVGRMAVLAGWRRSGVGGAILELLVELARELDHAEVVLNAQVHALQFYAGHGFVARGPEFSEAGIPHREMVRTLR